jgi:hypothetical protein
MSMSATAPLAPPQASSPWGWVALAWGAIGFWALLGHAIVRLTPMAWDAVDGGMSFGQWGVMAGWVIAMAYMEGYRGFQKRFSPRFAARAMHLVDVPSVGRGLLAPLFCMGLFHATRRVLVVSWGVTIGVVLLVIAIRQVDQPWRGIIDAGVIVGLTWGLVASVVWMVQAMRRKPMPTGPDVPAAAPTPQTPRA